MLSDADTLQQRYGVFKVKDVDGVAVPGGGQKITVSRGVRWAVRDQEKFASLLWEINSSISAIRSVADKIHSMHTILEVPKLTKADLAERCRDHIFKLLRFGWTNKRMVSIPNAHSHTLKWVLGNSREPTPWGSLSSWLRSDSHYKVYWVSGKAGSGKSVLMKHVCSQPRTRQLLAEWANGEPHLLYNHFFGTLERLYRSLWMG